MDPRCDPVALRESMFHERNEQKLYIAESNTEEQEKQHKKKIILKTREIAAKLNQTHTSQDK